MTKMLIDEISEAERAQERERLVQDALNKRLDVQQLERELARACKLYSEACARLVPIAAELRGVA